MLGKNDEALSYFNQVLRKGNFGKAYENLQNGLELKVKLYGETKSHNIDELS